MKIISSISGLRREVAAMKAKGLSIGFVPTMGCLHAGHLALARRSKKENDRTIMSIFVNPTQFGPDEDFARYPREKKKDVLLAKKIGVDIIFYPSVKEIYPERFLTYIDVQEVTAGLCGKSRPGHFRGVATVVGKLLNIVTPDKMYLGQKDAQQCVVLSQMVRDLNFPVQVILCPTVRETDGLAMSSRNSYLTEAERKEAPVLYRGMQLAKKAIAFGERNPAIVEGLLREYIQKNSSAKIDYVVCVDATTLKSIDVISSPVLIAVAAFFNKTRLIDNVIARCK